MSTNTYQQESQAEDRGSFDPMLLAVMSNALESIVREMTSTLLRTGRSAILSTARDFSCAIVTSGHQILATADSLPIHVLGAHYLTEAMSELHDDLAPGDAFLHNDPYHGNSHHADHAVLVPVFDGDTHLFTVIAKAHQADCGNALPTTYSWSARDIYAEGALNFPCVRIQRDFDDVPDIVRMCRRRIRVPDQWYGDYLAGLAAARIGQLRLTEFVDRYGQDTVKEFEEAWLDYSARRMGAAIRDLPAGTAAASTRHDAVPGMEGGLEITSKVTIDPERERIEVDLRDNPDCLENGLNLSKACALAAPIIGVLNQLSEPVPHNSGTFSKVEVLLREGCAVGIPRHPTSCSAATTNLADRVINATQAAFSHIAEGLGLAEGGAGQGPGQGVISGKDPRSDGPYVNQIILSASGGPASPTCDGWTSYSKPVAAGLMYRDSVEVDEVKYPILFDRVALEADSEGAGRQRGGFGTEVVFRPATDAPVTVTYLADMVENPPAGVHGACPGSPRRHLLRRASGEVESLVGPGEIVLEPGETLTDFAGGGGGYGPPMDRDPAAVREDVQEGLVTPERAAEVYGVCVESDRGIYRVDQEATDLKRSTEISRIS